MFFVGSGVSGTRVAYEHDPRRIIQIEVVNALADSGHIKIVKSTIFNHYFIFEETTRKLIFRCSNTIFREIISDRVREDLIQIGLILFIWCDI